MRVQAAIVLMALGGCAIDAEHDGALSSRSGAIIYGADDRKDVHEVDDPDLRAIAKWSTVALVPQNRLLRPASGGVQLVAQPLKDTLIRLQENGPAYFVCESEPFREQLAVADCTGVLIDDDLVLTAGHCFRDGESCDVYAYVFDFFEARPGALEHISATDVFGCRRIVARSVSPEAAASKVDYAIVQLDRPPPARRPVTVRKPMPESARAFEVPLDVGEPVVAIGYPSGLPAKIDEGGRVVATRAAMGDYFHLNSDTFKGSSGSGIYDANRELVGLLVRGGKDYVLSSSEASCLVSKVVPDGDGGGANEPGLAWEEATYVTQAIHGLCGLRYPSQRLCGIEPTCGDDFCSPGEDADNCPVDCEPEDCRGQSCGKGREPPIVGEEVPVEPEDGGVDAPDAGPEDGGAVAEKPVNKAGSCSLARGREAAGHVAFALALGAWFARRRHRRRGRAAD